MLRASAFIVFSWLLPLAAQQAANSESQQTGQAGFQPRPNIGGPTSTGAQLEEDDQLVEPLFRFERIDNLFQPWFDWKGSIDDQYGLRLGSAYTTVFLGASETLPGNENVAASGIFRILGRWDLIGKDTPHSGALVFNVDNRHRLGTDVSPSNLGFETGYYGIPAVLFNDLGWLLVDFHWQQVINGGKSGIIAGRYDPNDYLDVLGYANPWTTFLNAGVMFNTSIALSDVAVGVGGGHWITDQMYIGATINDANGLLNELGAFKHGGEFYTAVETGWSPSREERYFKKFHVMAWHTDRREYAGVDEGWGMTAGANWTFHKRLMPFIKVGASDGADQVKLLEASVSFGAIYKFFQTSDLVGLGVNWGKPTNITVSDENQWASELFYRLQVGQNMAITPTVQLIVNPANNPGEDTIWIGGFRARIAL
jgi:carbohydrate-selective porin OprB